MWCKVARRFSSFYALRAVNRGGNRSHTATLQPSRYWRRHMSASMSGEEAEFGDGKSQTPETPPGFLQVTEGRAKILFPSAEEVFYNPVQEVNRDLSTLVINVFTKKVWEPNRKKRKRKEVARLAAGTEQEGEKEKKGERKKEREGSKEEVEETKEKETADGSEAELRSSSDAGEDLAMYEDDKARSTARQTRNVLEEPHEEVEEVSVLEALAATGVRSIRYALEVPAVSRVMANDFTREAYNNMCRNIAHNRVESKVTPSCREASMLMYEHRDPLKQFTVIDIDPYGSPSVFLDSAVQAVSEGGILCITCTDTSVLCGVYPETCYSKYGSVSLRLKCGHEMGIRIFLSSLESHANRYKRYIVPLLSCCIDFYIRVFVQVFTSPSQVKRSLSKRSMVYACSGCDSHHLQLLGKRLEVGASKKYPAASGPPVDRTCAECGSTFKLGGPIWSEPTNNVRFVRSLLEELETHKQDYEHAARVRGLLAVVSEELPDVPLHYTLDQICNTLHCTMPNMLALRSAFMEQGYRISISHTHANAMKTDAPNSVLWDIMRCWVKMKPVKVKPTSPAAVILSKEPKIEASFSVRKDANPPSRIQKLARFPENPEPNWGPKARAKRKAGTAEDDQSECEGSKRSKIQDENTE